MKEKKGIIDLCNIVSSGDLCNHTGLRQLPPNAAETTLTHIYMLQWTWQSTFDKIGKHLLDDSLFSNELIPKK